MALNGLVIFKCFWTAPSAFSFTGYPDAVARESPSLAQQRVPTSSHRPTHRCSMVCYLPRRSGLCEADQNGFLALSLWSVPVAVSLPPSPRWDSWAFLGGCFSWSASSCHSAGDGRLVDAKPQLGRQPGSLLHQGTRATRLLWHGSGLLPAPPRCLRPGSSSVLQQLLRCCPGL